MARNSPEWLEQQYNNRARVPEHPAILDRWRQASALTRQQAPCRLDLPYGSGPAETLDIFPAPQRGAPVLVFVHGGYWRSLDKADHSFVAPAFTQAGAMVAVVNYALCPAVTVEAIALQTARAVAWVARHAADHGGDAARIVVAGHSAGGHLAAMMLGCRWREIDRGLPARLVRGALSISGLFDLAPLRRVPSLAPDLRLSAAAVPRLSPVAWPVPRGAVLHAWVGGAESEAFKAQTRAIRDAWGARAVPVCAEVPGANHFDVLHALADANSPLHRSALQLLGLAGAGPGERPLN